MISRLTLFVVIWTPICLAILRVIEKYVKFVFNPLRTNSNVQGPNDCGFLFGKFFALRHGPFMKNQTEWINAITGWDVPFVRYSLLLGRQSLLILDKDIVKEIASSPYGSPEHQLRFVKNPLRIQLLKNVLGDGGLISIEGERWKRHRQIIQPAFYTRILKESLDKAVPALTREFVQCWKQASSSGEREIDVKSHMSSLTLDIIGKMAFSHEFHALESVKSWAANDSQESNGSSSGETSAVLDDLDDPLVQAMVNAIRFSPIGLIFTLLGSPKLNKYFNPVTIRTRKALDVAVDQIISNAKEGLTDKDASIICNPTTPSLLGLLLEASERDSREKKSLTDVELRDHLTTFLFAGHETVATWCYMAIYSLVTYPGIQQKVYDDIVKHVDDHKEAEIDLASVDKMDYFNAFLQEVLRLHPPVGVTQRQTANDDFLGGHKIPKGTTLVMSAYMLHRHPKYWDNPLEFQPDRWINPTLEFQERIRFAFIPFGAGGRNCIGQHQAKVEAKLVMVELIRSFQFSLAPSQKDVKFTFSNIAVMTTNPDLRVIVQSRN